VSRVSDKYPVVVTVRISEEMKAWLDERGEDTDRTRPGVIRDLIRMNMGPRVRLRGDRQ
jgi:predicted transcriptional regulator